MKTKIMIMSVMAVLTLAACQNNEVKTSEEPEKVGKESVVEDTTKGEKESTEEQKEVKETEKESVEDHNNHDHQNAEDDINGLKAEDIIVTYFNAISLADSDVLAKVYPIAVEENARMAQLFKSSKVTTDIIGMKKVSLSSEKALYEVDVKIYTKEKDDNFTDNVSKYSINIDLTKGIIESTAITSTNYLE